MYYPRKSHKLMFSIIFTLLGSLLLAFAFFGICLCLQKRKKALPPKPNGQQDGLFPISTFDGNVMCNEIMQATKAFDAMYCIGIEGYRSVNKAKLISYIIVVVKKLHLSSNSESI